MAQFQIISQVLFVIIIAFQSLVPSTLIIVNNSSVALFVSDGIEMGAVLAPSQQYIVQDARLMTLFFYQAERVQIPQTFKLICRLKELVSSNQPTTVFWSDIAAKTLHAKYPGRFEIVPQMRLKFQQEHSAQLSVGRSDQVHQKHSMTKISNQLSHQSAAVSSSEPTQAVVDALMSQFSMLQEKQKSIDTADLKPKRTPPSNPTVSRKK